MDVVPAAQRSSWSSFLKACVFLAHKLPRAQLNYQHRRRLRRSLGPHRSSLYPLSHFSHRVSRYISPLPLSLLPAHRIGSAYWCERPHLFAAIADAPDAEARALAVLRWFIVRFSLFSLLPHSLSCPEHSQGSVHFQKRGHGLGEKVLFHPFFLSI